jgi:quinol monooxygenase YgiN
MLKIFRNILFNSALAVILLHTFIAHPHSEDMVEKEHIKLHNNSNSIYGILRFVFHESNDENLDTLVFADYSIEKKTKIDYQYSAINATYFNTSKIVNKKVYKNLKSNSNKLFIVNLNGVRGPPSFITNEFSI